MSEKDYTSALKEIVSELEYGDIKKIAKDLNLHPKYVSACLSEKSGRKSRRVLEAATDIVIGYRTDWQHKKERLSK